MAYTARFLFRPGVRLVRPGLWEVVKSSYVEYAAGGKVGIINIQPGFTFDGASTPAILRLLLAPFYVALGITKTDMHPAACIHDYLYRRQQGKRFADSIFGALLQKRAEEFEGFARRRRMWGAVLAEWAVRIGGGGAYRANGEKKRWAIQRARYLASRMQRGGEGREEFDRLEATYDAGFWRATD